MKTLSPRSKKYISFFFTIKILSIAALHGTNDRIRVTLLNRDTHDAHIVVYQCGTMVRERVGKFGGTITLDLPRTSDIIIEGGGTGSLIMHATELSSCNEINSMPHPTSPGRLVVTVTPLAPLACRQN